MKHKNQGDYRLSIDLTDCNQCGDCSRACSLRVIEMIDNSPVESPRVICNLCGHCVAICPVDAITINGMDMTNFHAMHDPGIKFSQLFQLVRNRKSIRNFLPKPIAPEELDALLDSVRYIPTGANRQRLKYLVITDPDRLTTVARVIAKKFKLLRKLARIPLIKPIVPKDEFLSLLRLVEHWDAWEGGEPGIVEPFLREAPCLIIIHTEKKHMLTLWEGGIASYNLILAAESLGLGMQLSGYTALTASIFKSIKKVAGVPKKDKIVAALILGYPNIEYRKTIDRHPLKITRIE